MYASLTDCKISKAAKRLDGQARHMNVLQDTIFQSQNQTDTLRCQYDTLKEDLQTHDRCIVRLMEGGVSDESESDEVDEYADDTDYNDVGIEPLAHLAINGSAENLG